MFDHTDNTMTLDELPAMAVFAPLASASDPATAFLVAPPSGRIRFALADLEAAERSPAYSVDMDTWHAPDRATGTCKVCMAGAVLASRHAIAPHQVYVGPFDAEGPDEFATTAAWDRILTSLDDLRDGYVDVFLIEDGRIPSADIDVFTARYGPASGDDPFPGHVAYEDDPAAFKAWARAIADKLESFGI